MSDEGLLCAHYIPEYGVCGKPKFHVVHQLHGLSSREHPFLRQASDETRTVLLTPDNLEAVAKESGRDIEDLKTFLEFSPEGIKVRYKVVNEVSDDA